MTQVLNVSLLNAKDFAPYGDVLEIIGEPDKVINAGMCDRYHNRAKLDFSDGVAGSVFSTPKRATFPMSSIWSSATQPGAKPLSH